MRVVVLNGMMVVLTGTMAVAAMHLPSMTTVATIPTASCHPAVTLLKVVRTVMQVLVVMLAATAVKVSLVFISSYKSTDTSQRATLPATALSHESWVLASTV